MTVSELAVGDLVQALPGCSLEDIYAPGDEGIVQATFVDEDRIHIVWSRSGRACSVRKFEWAKSFKYIKKQEVDVGDVVKVLPGLGLSMDGIEYYRGGDEGIVVSCENDDVSIAWKRTAQESSTTKATWMTFCSLIQKQADLLEIGKTARIHGLKGAAHLNGQLVTCVSFNEEKARWLVRDSQSEERLVKPANLLLCDGTQAALELQPGDLVEVVDGNEVSGAHPADHGTVQSCVKAADGEERITIVWQRTGEATSLRKAVAPTCLRFLSQQVLEAGDLVEALPGIQVTENGRDCYGPGDQASVLGFAGDGKDAVRLLWSRTNVTSEVPRASWMSFCYLREKGGGELPKMPAGKAPEPQVVKVAQGDRCTLRGLRSHPERNGMTVLCNQWDANKSRWLVILETDELVVEPIKMLVRPENLVPLKNA
mmetsp:Transcript_19082/g.34566  ORF Transcript_19082/g.34566 Transcript_19082/m.34566 type:complete len:426 (+) Transcript_19082:102-1379(+)